MLNIFCRAKEKFLQASANSRFPKAREEYAQRNAASNGCMVPVPLAEPWEIFPAVRAVAHCRVQNMAAFRATN